jgi:hypothetical protein
MRKEFTTRQKSYNREVLTSMERRKFYILFFLFVLCTVIFLPHTLLADWNGIVPNSTTKSEVLDILGEPSVDSGLVMIYDGERAPTGTKGAAVYCVRDIVVMVRIIPIKGLTQKDISVNFGSPTTVSFRNPEIEERVFESASGKIVVIFSKRDMAPIRIDYL